MTQEYTPTTEKVKQAYSGLHEKNYYDFTVMQREENFDRWLRKITSAAWEEGSDAGYAFAIRHPDQIPVNPYESEES